MVTKRLHYNLVYCCALWHAPFSIKSTVTDHTWVFLVWKGLPWLGCIKLGCAKKQQLSCASCFNNFLGPHILTISGRAIRFESGLGNCYHDVAIAYDHFVERSFHLGQSYLLCVCSFWVWAWGKNYHRSVPSLTWLRWTFGFKYSNTTLETSVSALAQFSSRFGEAITTV